MHRRDWVAPAKRKILQDTASLKHTNYAMALHEDIPAHVEARIAEVRDFFKGQFKEGARRVEQHARKHCEMFAAALREEAHRGLISVEGSSASRQARVQEELVRARHGEEHSVGMWKTEMTNARAQAAAEHEAAVARCRSSSAAALDNARDHAENRCERLEEGFVRERDRAAVAELVLTDQGAQLREEQAMVSELRDTALGMQAQVDEFVQQYKRVIDRECSDVKKHERDLGGERRSLGVARGERCDRAPPGAPAGQDAGFSWLRPGGAASETVGVCSCGAHARVPWDVEDEGGFRNIS